MTAAQLATLTPDREREDECVRCWRLEELVRAGYEVEDATDIAFHLDVDLHDAVALIRRGCSSALAVQIVL